MADWMAAHLSSSLSIQLYIENGIAGSSPLKTEDIVILINHIMEWWERMLEKCWHNG